MVARRTAAVLAAAAAAGVLATSWVVVELTDDVLTWAPPHLDAPETVDLTSDQRTLHLDDDRDYVVDVGGPGSGTATAPEGEGFTIDGGRDVVLVGGRLVAPGSDRALYLHDQQGTVHVEGVHITGEDLGEGIDVSSDDAVVQIQNVLVDEVRGSRDGHHADVVQTWNGPRRLLIDRLDGTTTYQGFMWQPGVNGDTDDVEVYDVRNTTIRKPSGGGYPIVKSNKHGDWRIETDDVTVVRPEGEPRGILDGRSEAEVGDDWDGVDVARRARSPVLGDPGPSYESPGYREDD